MKKFVSIFLLTSMYISSFAQLDVFDNNYIGIGGLSQALSMLSVNGEGKANTLAYIYQPTVTVGYKALHVVRDAPTEWGWAPAIQATAKTGYDGVAIALLASAQNSSKTSYDDKSQAIGVYGLAGHAGLNIGVYGTLNSSSTVAPDGAGIFGSSTGYVCAVSGRYAGYFNGPVKIKDNNENDTIPAIVINGQGYIDDIAISSDERLKTNVVALSSNNGVDKLKNLRPVKYDKKFVSSLETTAKSDTTKTTTDIDIIQTDQVGFLAQEMAEVFPEFVYKRNDDIYYIDYISLIPLSIQAINEQETELAAQEEKISAQEEKIESLEAQIDELKQMLIELSK